jgi:hypothetical protein
MVAARMQARLLARTLIVACEAATGPVTLWVTPDESSFRELVRGLPIRLARQPSGDLGARMSAAVAEEAPVLIIGTDCPVLKARHLRDAAGLLRDGADAVLIPAEDGGYVLIGMRSPHPGVFTGVTWSSPAVLAQTRQRLRDLNLGLAEFPPLWDIDVPQDLERMRRWGLEELIPDAEPSAVDRFRDR